MEIGMYKQVMKEWMRFRNGRKEETEIVENADCAKRIAAMAIMGLKNVDRETLKSISRLGKESHLIKMGIN
uniref:Uncharacterized protein n=1 Tax=Onchocerca volvulus TaxID=6282 RepID=A0A8R1TUB2_ONCVO